MPVKAEKHLVINIRDESYDDFVSIGKRINRLDGSIIVSVFNGNFTTDQIPSQVRHLKLLNLYLVNPPAVLPAQGHTVAVSHLGKIIEYDGFVAAGVPIPKAIPFQLGDTVDPEEWGPYVVLKPTHLSLGVGVLLMPTKELLNLNPSHIPAGHPLASEPYLLQRFIDTGPYISSYRVLCLLGVPLMCYEATNLEPIHYPETIAEAFDCSPFAATVSERRRTLVVDEEVNAFAVKAFAAHGNLPLQGLDIAREVGTGQLYVFENNCGGNVWSFSKTDSNPYRAFGRKAMVTQFNAWDRAAEVLVETTNRLAR